MGKGRSSGILVAGVEMGSFAFYLSWLTMSCFLAGAVAGDVFELALAVSRQGGCLASGVLLFFFLVNVNVLREFLFFIYLGRRSSVSNCRLTLCLV